MKSKLKEMAESLSVAAVLLLVLLPVRVFFVRYVSDDWLGSFGLITVISILIIYLAKKDKLGWFGRAFHRQMWKIHRGKRKYFAYTQMTLALIFFSLSVFAIEVGNSLYAEEKQILKDEIDIETMQELSEKMGDELDPKDLPYGLLVFLYILIFRFDIYSTILSTLNDLSDGYVLHFSTVFLVEVIELIGIAIYTRITIKTEKFDDGF